MRKRIADARKPLVTVVAVVLTAVLLLAACATPATQPEQKKVVEVGDMLPLTGHGASAAQPILEAEIAYYKYFNEEMGIPGVTIQLSWIDVGTEAPRAIAAYRRFVDSGMPIITSTSTSGTAAIQPMLAKDNMAMVSLNTGDTLVYPPGNIYCFSPTWAEQFGAFADYVMENWKESRPPKLGFITSDSAWGMEPVAQGTKYARSIGIEMLPIEFVPFVTLDATTNLLRLSDQGVDVVYIHGLPATVVPILKDAERLGLLGKIQFGGNGNGLNEGTVKGAGSAAEGYLAPLYWPFFSDTEVPGVEKTIDMLMETHGEVIMDGGYLSGRIYAGIPCEAIRRAIENVGYENLDSGAVIAELNGFKDVDLEGLTRVTYTQDRTGFRFTRMYTVRDGKIVRISEWAEAPRLVP